MFDLAEILHAGQPFHLNVFEDRNFENPIYPRYDFFPENCLKCSKMTILKMDKTASIMVPEPCNKNLMKNNKVIKTFHGVKFFEL